MFKLGWIFSEKSVSKYKITIDTESEVIGCYEDFDKSHYRICQKKKKHTLFCPYLLLEPFKQTHDSYHQISEQYIT